MIKYGWKKDIDPRTPWRSERLPTSQSIDDSLIYYYRDVNL